MSKRCLDQVDNRDDRIVFDRAQHKYWIDNQLVNHSVTSIASRKFPFDATSIINSNFKAWQQNGKYKELLHDIEGEDEQKARIAQLWKQNAEKGTEMHAKIAEALTEGTYDDNTEEMKQFYHWKNEWEKTWTLYRTEWSIFDESTKLCGTINSLWKNKASGTLALVDWKRTTKPPHAKDKLKLNIYKQILEDNYEMHIREMYLVRFHPDLNSRK